MKPTRRKWIAGLLTLSMLFTMIPGTMFAAGAEGNSTGTAPTSGVVQGHYEGDIWQLGNPTQNLTEGITKVDKTAERTDTNQYKVTLTVETQTTSTTEMPGAAATVLMIDTSGSMKGDRLKNAKIEAQNFVDIYGGINEEGKATAPNSRRMLAVVTFAGDAETKSNWVDVSTETGAEAAKAAIGGLDRTYHGTNLDAGLRQ